MGQVVHALPHFPALPARLAIPELTGTATSSSLQKFSETSLLSVRFYTGLPVFEFRFLCFPSECLSTELSPQHLIKGNFTATCTHIYMHVYMHTHEHKHVVQEKVSESETS